ISNMHDLLSLPNELTIQVIDELDLTDTWSFAQTSKEIYNLSQSATRRHREYKEKYLFDHLSGSSSIGS
ncbi:MAG: hypothetical protein L6R36_009556, partial [Xanthoria steineri]